MEMISEMDLSGPSEIDFGIEEIDEEDTEDLDDSDEDEDEDENEDYDSVCFFFFFFIYHSEAYIHF